jgi:hypothetical protein
MRRAPSTRRVRPTVWAVQTIYNAGRETQLFMHAVGSALACASQTEAVVLDLRGRCEPSPAAQKEAVAERLAAVMTDLEAVIRSQNPPPRMSAATAGRVLVERGEVYDAVNRTYTPGPGLQTLIEGLLVDAATRTEAASWLPTAQDASDRAPEEDYL